jgi:restriction system protein
MQMAEQTRERLAQYQFNVLNLLAKSPEGLHANDVISQLDSVMPATDFELGSYATGGIRRPKIIRFTTIGLVKAGWLLKTNGIWSITADGKQALLDYPTPSQIRAESHRLYQGWKKSRVAELPEEIGEEDDEAIALAVSVEDAESTALELVKKHLGVMNPYIFQNLVSALLEGMGYHVAWVAPPGKDGGIDLVAFQDHFGAQVQELKSK